jgi:patatin-like phospholipase/acyl hydrolase
VKPYFILALDGGGIRGVLTLRMLERLESAHTGWLNKVRLFAGTSTGGIIALGLGLGFSPADLLAFYREAGPKIFRDSWLDDARDLKKVIGADYDYKNLKRALQQRFGDSTLADLERRVLIPSFDLDAPSTAARPRMWKPKFFHNFPGPDTDGAEKVVDVAVRTSAAPTYFPSYQGYIDGGVAANNPSMAALAQALNPETGKQQIEHIRLLSVGTGLNPNYIQGKRLDWGYAQWARPLISLMIDGSMGVADYECRQVLQRQYHRLCPILPAPFPMDDAGKVEQLLALADQVDLAPTLAWLQSG